MSKNLCLRKLSEKTWRILSLAAAALLLAACGLFGDKDEEIEPKRAGRLQKHAED